ncbi:hypothetical protein D9619_008783 [Psilocybe cf. subviscida]|uniref:Uncharacterized protein n=1 Tax=Psilocybe cf. subviscida TaxID=2480587 RepID=A0A8H5B9R9_9AGAR|nr:hypothetical protein D9619_008783 [Psilocybe cf. subviscida]
MTETKRLTINLELLADMPHHLEINLKIVVPPVVSESKTAQLDISHDADNERISTTETDYSDYEFRPSGAKTNGPKLAPIVGEPEGEGVGVADPLVQSSFVPIKRQNEGTETKDPRKRTKIFIM